MSTKLGNALRRAAGKEGDYTIARRLNEAARKVDKTVFALGKDAAVNSIAVRDATKLLKEYEHAHAPQNAAELKDAAAYLRRQAKEISTELKMRAAQLEAVAKRIEEELG